MFKIHLNIGSNQGCRRENIERAAALVEHIAQVTSSLRSEIVESEPWGFESPNRFLNMGMLVESSLHPSELFPQLVAIQNSISPQSHRNADGTYADRQVDIDVIAAAEKETGRAVVLAEGELILPHPQMHLRDFVLLPLLQLEPGWVHPLTGIDGQQLLINVLTKS